MHIKKTHSKMQLQQRNYTLIKIKKWKIQSLPCGPVVKTSWFQHMGSGFDPWSGKIPQAAWGGQNIKKKNQKTNHTPVKMAKMKYNGNTKFWQGYGATETSMHWRGGWMASLEKQFVSYQTWQSLSKVLTQEKENLCSQRNLDTAVLLLVPEDQKQFKYLFNR